MATAYTPTLGLTHVTIGSRVYWKYSNGNYVKLSPEIGDYDRTITNWPWVEAVYSTDGGNNWNTASSYDGDGTVSYSINSLSNGQSVILGVIWWDYNPGSSNSASESLYRKDTYTKIPTIGVPSFSYWSNTTSHSMRAYFSMGSNSTITYINLYRSDGSLIESTSTSNSYYDFTGLSASTSYYVRLQGYSGGYSSSWSSNSSTNTTSAANPPANCYIYLDSDGSFMLYSNDSNVTKFQYYDYGYTNTWVDMAGTVEGASSHTYGAGYVSWAKRQGWLYVDYDSSKPNLNPIYGRAVNADGYAYSSSMENPYYKCPRPTYTPTFTVDSTNVNITYPPSSFGYYGPYTVVSEYSVDSQNTWNPTTSSTYPLTSLANAVGKTIYVRSKYTCNGRRDSDWGTVGYYTASPCPSVGTVSVSERSDASGIDITISSIPSGYTLWVEYQEQGYPNWYPVQQSTSSYATSNYTTFLSASGIPSGTVLTIRAYLTKSGFTDGSKSYSNQITYIQGTCPVPNTLTATYNVNTGNIDIYVSADSGYFIQVLYNTGGSNNFLTNGYSPVNYNFDVSSIGNGTTVTIYAYCTKSYYNNSSWVSASVYLNRKPVSSNLFNFISGQQMTAQNIVKGTNGNYTAESIVMPASTWNSFTSKINEVRAYYSNKYSAIGQFSFTSVGPGSTFTAGIYNEARNAINGMFDTYEQLPAVTSGVTDITATVLMSLQSKLNAVN